MILQSNIPWIYSLLKFLLHCNAERDHSIWHNGISTAKAPRTKSQLPLLVYFFMLPDILKSKMIYQNNVFLHLFKSLETILQWALARSAQTSMSLVNHAENQDNQISKVFKCSWEVEDIWCKVGVAASWLLIPLYIPHYPKHHTAPTYFLHQAPHPLIILHLVTSAPTTSAFHYTAPTYTKSNKHTLHHTAPIYPPTKYMAHCVHCAIGYCDFETFGK